MQDSIQDVAYVVGSAVVSPGPGSAELILGLLVACGFIASALYGLCSHCHMPHWHDIFSRHSF